MICDGCARDVEGFVCDAIPFAPFIILSRTCDFYAYLLYFVDFCSFPLSIRRYGLTCSFFYIYYLRMLLYL